MQMIATITTMVTIIRKSSNVTYLGTIEAGRFLAAGIARRMQPAAGMMPDRMLGMAIKIQRRMGRRVRPLASLLGALDGALVDRGIKYALALLGAVLLVHRPPNLLALGR